MTSPERLILPSLLLLLALSSSSAKTFRCTSTTTTCQSLIDYVSPNATTLHTIRLLFDIRNLRSILGANDLPLDTPANYPVASKQTLKIPLPCACRNGTGRSNRRPVYRVVPGDGLDHIARDVFSGLVVYQEIQEANNISDPNLIEVGDELWIPLPCSCDDVDGQGVVHYGHVLATGSTVEGIAQMYNTTRDTLLGLNNLTVATAQQLVSGDVLDVPLRACSSMVNNNSLDYPLLVANGTYTFTANNCVRCRCDAANNWMLQCDSSGVNSSCSPVRCEGSENLSLGNSTTSGCNRNTCAYAGYNQTILTTVATDSTCPAPAPGSSATSLQGWRWNNIIFFAALYFYFHLR